jgi:hypothetical protein
MRNKADVRRPLGIYGYTLQLSSHHNSWISRSLSSLSERNCARRRPRIRATRWSKRAIALRLLLRAVAHRLDLVAVGIAEERAVVVGVIVAQAGRPIIGAAGRDPGLPECIHLAA